MSDALTYIQQNNLPARTWIDATNPTQRSIVGNTFTLFNRTGNTQYNFIQQNPNNHPIVTSEGISFSSSDSLSPVNSNLFNDIESYSLIFITKGDISLPQTLLSVGKTNPSLPSFLDYGFSNTRPYQQFSLLNLSSTLIASSSLENTQTILLNHNVRLGHTELSINKTPFTNLINTNKGHVLNNLASNFFLGNSASNIPFTGTLLHFLMFSPAISQQQLLDLSELLLITKPFLLPDSRELSISFNENLSLDTVRSVIPRMAYLLPVRILPLDLNGKIDLTVATQLVVGYFWNSIDIDIWNNLDTDIWDKLN